MYQISFASSVGIIVALYFTGLYHRCLALLFLSKKKKRNLISYDHKRTYLLQGQGVQGT